MISPPDRSVPGSLLAGGTGDAQRDLCAGGRECNLGSDGSGGNEQELVP